MDYLIAGYAFVVGSIVGSFLNVVVARVPEGRSIVHPPSSCPACGHRIRLRDNVPILGWLMLKGHCRDCGVRIPFRYPAVELCMALVFLVLVVVEVLANGSVLPAGVVDPASGVRHSAKPYTNPALWSIYLFHVSFFCVLLSASLMQLDGKIPPRQMIATTVFAGILVSALRPEVQPIGFMAGMNTLNVGAPILGLLNAIVGGAVGAAIGWEIARTEEVLHKAGYGRELHRTSFDTLEICVLEHALVGVVFGWQTTVMMSFFAAACRFGWRGLAGFSQPSFPSTTGGSLWLMTLWLLFGWGPIARQFDWPASSLAMAAGTVLLAGGLHVFCLWQTTSRQ